MSEVTIYHNPRCSKSRETLKLLQEHDVALREIRYLETPPDPATLSDLLDKLGLPARELLRKNESEYKELGLADPALEERKLLEAMSEHPRLIQRPIVVRGNKAVLGRPPENVLNLL